MSTIKKRLNITLTPEMDEFITFLAKKDGVPQATKISQILQKTLEDMEDQILLEIALEREKENNTWISHHDIWKVLENKTK